MPRMGSNFFRLCQHQESVIDTISLRGLYLHTQQKINSKGLKKLLRSSEIDTITPSNPSCKLWSLRPYMLSRLKDLGDEYLDSQLVSTFYNTVICTL